MKKLVEWLKDSIYDASDFLIVAVVLVAVGGVIGWKLPELFTDSPTHISSAQAPKEKTDTEIVTETTDQNQPNTDEDTSVSDETNNGEVDQTNQDETTEQDENSEETANQDNTQVNEQDTVTTTEPEVSNTVTEVKISIPAKSLPSDIAGILLSNNLIQSKKDFLNKALELKLDRKLRSGDYIFKSNSTLEDIIYKLAGK